MNLKHPFLNPISLFRVFLFSGILIHFLPVILAWDENFGHGAYQTHLGSAFISEVPDSAVIVSSAVLILSSVLGIFGRWVKLSSAFAFGSAWVLISVNALNLNTLGLWTLFHLLFVISLLGDKHFRSPGRFFLGVALIQPWVSVFFSGLEKALSHWGEAPVLYSFLNSTDSVVRPWIFGSSLFQNRKVCLFLQWVTMLAELGIPILILFKPTRRLAFALWCVFFISIYSILQIPPLFFLEFLGAGFLFLAL